MNIIHEFFYCDTHYLGRVNKLHQSRIILDSTRMYEQLEIYTQGLSNYFSKEYFISMLKDAICARVLMQWPSMWLEYSDRALKVELVIKY